MWYNTVRMRELVFSLIGGVYINLSYLKPGMDFKNYKELCNFIDEPYLSGKSKILQLSRWKNHFTFSRKGNHYLINQIIQPIPTEFKGKYNSLICPLILSLIPDEDILTYPELFKALGVSVNPYHPDYPSRYSRIRSHMDYSLKHLADHRYITYSHDQSFSNRLLTPAELSTYHTLQARAISHYGIKNTFRKQQVISNYIKTRSYTGYSYPVIHIKNLHKSTQTYNISELQSRLAQLENNMDN